MSATTTYSPALKDIQKARMNVNKVVIKSPLVQNMPLSQDFNANVYLKREDLQIVRSYKLRGAYNKISGLSVGERLHGVVCASAGNHAQGVAYACKTLEIKGTIYMPAPTPVQKIEQVKMFGGDFIEIILHGDSFDDAYNAAIKHSTEKEQVFIHPFDDPEVIEGQATVGLEIIEQAENPIDYLFLPIGGGGLAAGVSSVFKMLSPSTKIIGVEPFGAPAMATSVKKGYNVTLDEIDHFVDGAAVKKVGDITFDICRDNLDDVITVKEGKICEIILQLYNRNAIVAEPAGALTIAALSNYHDQIIGKNVVCLLSGGNNDITRTEEIKERALLHKGLKHYFIVRFPQRSGALKEFVTEILGPDDDITYFEYKKKSSRQTGPAVVGVQVKKSEDLEPLITRMKEHHFFGEYLNDKPDLFQFLV